MNPVQRLRAELQRIDELIAILFARVGGGSIPVPAGTIQQIRVPFTLANASSAALLPAGAFVKECTVEIDTPYNAGATISVGQTGTPTSFQATADNNPQIAGLYEENQETSAVGGLAVLVTVTGAAAGSGVAWVTYAVPLA